ncbi:GNAT family N-acetyltransferase [Phycicoccus sp. CSK15P-2]|uniref:GNAT family N-acetyltransferase n=1 Tax=Phycicoccus sp. CSK15P-2 TaxID=2807627 RepID=UPI00194F8D88|nr:GNAT family N-acetyltransferase [Phycicoccus sp. CSK15P-2]MBM6405583.1 GNAT family N-acetyltransferase [Phycicoccus sp. CSK15P-2]
MADAAGQPTDPGAAPGIGPALRVERVTEDSWRAYRDVRQASLLDSPRAFWTTYAESAARTDEEWRERAASTGLTWLAWHAERPVGTVGLWHAPHLADDEVHLVGMWVAAPARGTGAADALVDTALAEARRQGWTRVLLDAARENGRAARFYRRRGFVPTGETGTMPWDPTCVEERMALDLR